jgi:AraC-like DNA-binding protein
MRTYQEILPGPRLARYVECYWWSQDLQGTQNHCVLPDGCVDILFSARNGEPVSLAVVGLMTAPQTIDVPSGHLYFGVRFRPGMAVAFMPDTPQLNDKIESLEQLSGITGRQIFDQLSESKHPMEMARVMDNFLRPLEPRDAGCKAIELLAGPETSLDHLASEAGISVRQLRRVCLERAGVSPKYLARILRFRRAADRIGALANHAAQPNFAQLAAASGYFDQAHFIREFRQFAGCTPGRYLQSLKNRSA